MIVYIFAIVLYYSPNKWDFEKSSLIEAKAFNHSENLFITIEIVSIIAQIIQN